MDGSEFVDTVRSANDQALDRLGSEKALVATTGANLDRETVLETAAEAEARAAETFQGWAADESDDRAREAFEDAATRERDHRERVVSFGNLSSPEPEPDPLHEHLRGLDDTVDRVAAGLVARPLVASRSLLQVVNFFVNEPDEDAADLFRELRAETDAQVDRGAQVIEIVCGTDGEWDQAATAASETIESAYEEYAGALEELGIDPKPVC